MDCLSGSPERHRLRVTSFADTKTAQEQIPSEVDKHRNAT